MIIFDFLSNLEAGYLVSFAVEHSFFVSLHREYLYYDFHGRHYGQVLANRNLIETFKEHDLAQNLNEA